MKALDFSKFGWIVLFVFFLICNIGNSQNKFIGSWEGIFMKEFRIHINFNAVNDHSYTGKLVMYSGENRIQNDELSEISLQGNKLKFMIPAKETEFNGVFNENRTELKGNFIFPDGSEHSLTVVKGGKSEPLIVHTFENFIKERAKKYTNDELKTDLQFLMDKLKEYHPQLYSYTSAKAFDMLFDRLKKELNAELTLEEYYKLIAPIIDKVKCSHTGARLPKSYLQNIHAYGNFLPLKLAIIKNKAYYLSDYGNFDSKITPGSEILRINNATITDIIPDLLVFIPSEGRNSTTKFNDLNHNFNSYFYLIDHSENFDVQIINSGSEKKIMTVPACNFKALYDQKRATSGIPVEFILDVKKSIGLLKIKSFGLTDITEFIQQMDTVFQSLNNKNIQNLIIDLRDNSGGHPIFGAQLFSYLTENEFNYFKRNTDVPEFEPLYNTMQPSKYHFKGKIYVFTNGGCLSTTGHLISLIQYHTNALFIGEEPGSSFYCNDQSIQVVLPNTGIEVNIPRTTFETATTGYKKEVPFKMNYKVNDSLSNLLNGKDSYMKFLFEMIEK
jgi:hypothetical protein